MSSDSTSERACSFPDCGKSSHHNDGLCAGHHWQRKHDRELVALKFRRKKGTPPRIICDEAMCPVPGLIGPCHIFRGAKNDKGYGHVTTTARRKKYVHRLMWEAEVGPIPDGLEIDHQCRVHACCNVDHLRAVTHEVNVRAGLSGHLQAAKTHCPQGHPYDEENTYHSEKAGRICRQCQRDRWRKKATL